MRQVKAVLLDVDGLMLSTETLILEVSTAVVARYGKELSTEVAAQAIGMRPLEAWHHVATQLGLPRTAEQLVEESEALLRDRWHEASLLPGVARLVCHLCRHGIPMALATSTPRATLRRKLSTQQEEIVAAFKASCCGDEVENGKPAPDIFLEAARQLAIPPEDCLVFEDAPAGVAAAAAAGCRTIVVPSITDHSAYPAPDPAAAAGCVELLPSLLDFRPEQYGLPPFSDYVCGCVPLRPLWRIGGTVVKGFGRGSKTLGIPTANLDAGSLRGALAEAVTGIYAGWAAVGDSGAAYKCCMSVGFNPVFGNKERTCEPWLLHDFGHDFYGAPIRLVVCAYIRPEANFPSLQALVDRIQEDARVARQALDQPPFAELRGDPFLVPAAEGSADGPV